MAARNVNNAIAFFFNFIDDDSSILHEIKCLEEEEEAIINFLSKANNLHFGSRWSHYRNKDYFEGTISR